MTGVSDVKCDEGLELVQWCEFSSWMINRGLGRWRVHGFQAVSGTAVDVQISVVLTYTQYSGKLCNTRNNKVMFPMK